jgi:hypothetical protein
LLPEIYSLGGTVPTAADAQAAIEAAFPDTDLEDSIRRALPQAIRASHVYALFTASSEPGPATLTFSLGGGGGPATAMATKKITLDVMP